MTLKDLIDDAFTRGRSIKEEILSDLSRNELFIQAVSRVIQKADEVKMVLRRNIRSVFEMMDVPTREDIDLLTRKVAYLEKMVDRAGKRAVTVRSLAKIQKIKKARPKIKR